MDQTQLQQQIAKYYSKLPTNSQKLFSSMSWMENLKNIISKFNLNSNQAEILGTETTLVLLGITHLGEYKDILKKDLSISDEILNKIIEEINNSILIKSIIPELEEAYDDNLKSLVEEKYGNTQKLDERFDKLPKEVKDAINNSGYQLKLYDLAKEKGLSINQMQVLEETTNKVLLNIIHPDRYEDELKSSLGVSDDKTTEIVKSVNDNILMSIRDILKQNFDKPANKESLDIDDEVPIPPYAVKKPEAPKTIVIEPVQLPKTESKIYQNAGIEMISDETKKEDLTKSIIASKLTNPTVSKPIVSDQSIPKMTTPVVQTSPQASSPTKPHDPYHEAI